MDATGGNKLVVGVGFEPTKPGGSGFTDRILCPLGYPTKAVATLTQPRLTGRTMNARCFRKMVLQTGVEPVRCANQAQMLPLHHRSKKWYTDWESNPELNLRRVA